MLKTTSLASTALLCSLAALSGCAPSDETVDSEPQTTCGRHVDLQDVEVYDGTSGVSRAFVNRHRLAVGLLRWKEDIAIRYREQSGNVSGVGWCTGTLIAQDLFLTAAHCLDPRHTKGFRLPREKGGVLLRPSELAREFLVEFRYELSAQTGQASVGQTFEVVRLEEYQYDDLDYAILRLNGGAGLINGVARVAPKDARAGSPIAILQHPSGTPMKVGAGAVASVQQSRLSYGTIDTLGGSSGAGILDGATGKLVGIHTNGGCTQEGGANYGITIEALTAASPTLESLVDHSTDFLVGDWDNDGSDDLAVFHEGCLYPDANHDALPDLDRKHCPAKPDADEYFVGRWEANSGSRLGWRVGACVYVDTDPQRPLCYGNERDRFEILVADWNGDRVSDIGVQRGPCIDFDTDRDGLLDERGYCFGSGLGEDQYLAADWNGSGVDRIAVRRGHTVLVDSDRDGAADDTYVYGSGGNEAQYLAGDWNGDGRAKLAVRRRNLCFMSHDAEGGASENGVAEEGRLYRDFWSAP